MPITANGFSSNRAVPFCIQDVDLAAIDYDQEDASIISITGLSYEEVVNLYWNTEHIEVSFNITGNNGSTIDEINFTGGALTAPIPVPPNERVCLGRIYRDHVLTVANAAVFASVTSNYTLIGQLSTELPDWLSGEFYSPITRHTDGKYCLWYQLLRSGSDDPHMGIGGGGRYEPWFGAPQTVSVANYIDIPILDGGTRIYGYHFNDDFGGYPTGAVTLNSVSITFVSYVYD